MRFNARRLCQERKWPSFVIISVFTSGELRLSMFIKNVCYGSLLGLHLFYFIYMLNITNSVSSPIIVTAWRCTKNLLSFKTT